MISSYLPPIEKEYLRAEGAERRAEGKALSLEKSME